jgi:hypothetical protein
MAPTANHQVLLMPYSDGGQARQSRFRANFDLYVYEPMHVHIELQLSNICAALARCNNIGRRAVVRSIARLL